MLDQGVVDIAHKASPCAPAVNIGQQLAPVADALLPFLMFRRSAVKVAADKFLGLLPVPSARHMRDTRSEVLETQCVQAR